MRLIKELILLTIAIAGVSICFIELSAQYDQAIRTEEARCFTAHRNANWLHIEFRSDAHAEAWCEAHKDDWRSLVNGRVLSAAAELDSILDNNNH